MRDSAGGSSLGAARGVVHLSAGGIYEVVLDGGERIEASLRGRMKRGGEGGSGRVVIGDRVVVTPSRDAWTIDSVEERATQLVRRDRTGRRPKLLAANLDRVLAVVGLRAPPATPELIDRLLVLVESCHIRPTLVLNKLDLEDEAPRSQELARLYAEIGYRVHRTSAVSGAGLPELGAELREGSSALIGPSGVGKSSLLNAVDPGLGLRTGALSGKTGTGRHTTVGSRLVALAGGGLVADTPGFGDVGLWAVPPEEIAACYPDFTGRAESCRFRACTHVHEPDCGVRAGVEAGDVVESRYASYRLLRAEAEAASAR